VIGANKEAKWARLRVFYENVDVFVIDEVNAMSAAELGFLDEMMRNVFDPDGKVNKPFGGKMMIFMGDAAQLKPVSGAVNADAGLITPCTERSGAVHTVSEQELYLARERFQKQGIATGDV